MVAVIRCRPLIRLAERLVVRSRTVQWRPTSRDAFTPLVPFTRRRRSYRRGIGQCRILRIVIRWCRWFTPALGHWWLVIVLLSRRRWAVRPFFWWGRRRCRRRSILAVRTRSPARRTSVRPMVCRHRLARWTLNQRRSKLRLRWKRATNILRIPTKRSFTKR